MRIVFIWSGAADLREQFGDRPAACSGGEPCTPSGSPTMSPGHARIERSKRILEQICIERRYGDL